MLLYNIQLRVSDPISKDDDVARVGMINVVEFGQRRHQS